MFQSTLSPASAKAAALIGAEMGLMTSSTAEPILCLAALGRVAGFADEASKAASAGADFAGDALAAVVNGDVGDAVGDAIDAVGDFFSSIFYLSPGRMSALAVMSPRLTRSRRRTL